MNEENDTLIKEQFQKLPLELQRAIETVSWKAMVKEIATTNKLSPDQEEILERETMFIIYGFEPPANYIDSLVRELQIDEELAISIAEKANEKIFEEIALKMVEEEKGVIHHNLPMVEKGEVAHTVPHVETPVVKAPTTPTLPPQGKAEIKPEVKEEEKPISVPVPDYRYAGKDPYREPLN